MIKKKHLPLVTHIFQLALAGLLAGGFMFAWVLVGQGIFLVGKAFRIVFMGQ